MGGVGVLDTRIWPSMAKFHCAQRQPIFLLLMCLRWAVLMERRMEERNMAKFLAAVLFFVCFKRDVVTSP